MIGLAVHYNVVYIDQAPLDLDPKENVIHDPLNSKCQLSTVKAVFWIFDLVKPWGQVEVLTFSGLLQ